MQYMQGLWGPGEARILSFKVGATVAAGVYAMVDTNQYGEVIPCSTTSATDGLGVALNTGTYSTTQGATEGVVEVVINPYGVTRAKVSGSSTADTALSAATYHVLTNTSASAGGTVVTATTAGTDFTGGYCFMLTGANAGLKRVITTVTSTTSITVTVPFPNAIAVGDKALILPYSRQTHKVQATATFIQADGSIAWGTGLDAAVINVDIPNPVNTTTPEVFVEFVLQDHFYNPID
jgi:hypothetical protein